MLQRFGRSAPGSTAGEPESLSAAFHRAVTFPTSQAALAGMSPDQIQASASEEATFGRVAIDERGLTAGMRLNAFQPVTAVVTEWRQARAAFDRLLTPYRKDIDAVDRLDTEIAELEGKCGEEVGRREEMLQQDTRYLQIERRYQRAEARFEEKFAENNQRIATIWGFHPSYVIAIGCIGIAEWLINYDTFFLFMQVPAIAAGATIILGVLLAFAAHGHGTLLKQWSHRFGKHRTPAERLGDWRLLALSTLGLVIVLGAAGGSRYAAALRAIASQPQYNILGAEAEIQLNPLRDVLLSLLANIAAWAVGVFVAYMAHDPDPEYMEAAHEREKAQRLYNRRRRRINREIESIRARYGKQIAEKGNAAKARSRGVEDQRNLLLQVREHEQAIMASLETALRTAVEAYRDALVRMAQQKGSLVFVRSTDGQVLTPQDYKNAPLLIDADLVRGLS